VAPGGISAAAIDSFAGVGWVEMIERLASWSRSRLTMQGYGGLSDEERKSLWLGLRFSTGLCFAGIALGVALASPALLLAMAVTAGVGGFLTRKHPFDYAYDAAVRPLLGGPGVPPSPAPRRFACQLATPWIVAIAVALLADAAVIAWVLAVPLLAVAATVTVTNWCLPSLIYGLLHRRQAGEVGC
jgi:hypothetical protein